MSGSEELVQQQIRMALAGVPSVVTWRNNVGAAQDATGRVIRYGLMNDSKELNERFKSSDLVGIRPVVVTPEMVGRTLGVFFAVEVKAVNWTASITDKHTLAQKRYLDLVTEAGGLAGFAQSVHDARNILKL